MVVRDPGWRPDLGAKLEAVLEEHTPPEQELDNNLEENCTPNHAKMINYFPSYAREDSSVWAYFDTIGSRAYVDLDLTRIHGSYHLAKGYTFAIVPRNAKLDHARMKTFGLKRQEPAQYASQLPLVTATQSDTNISSTFEGITTVEDQVSPHSRHSTGSDEDSASGNEKRTVGSVTNNIAAIPMKSDISSTYSVVKALASLIQLLAGLETLVLYREDVIGRWGYAAFHLTVIPYMLMTMVNFISNLLVADYACLYMVESETMWEAEARGSKFTGVVASLQGYHIQNHAHFSAKEVAGWNGFTQRHMANIATFLRGDLMEIDLSIRRTSHQDLAPIHTLFKRIDTRIRGSDRISSDKTDSRGKSAGTQHDIIEQEAAPGPLLRSSNVQDHTAHHASNDLREDAILDSTVAANPASGDQEDGTVHGTEDPDTQHEEEVITTLESPEGRKFRIEEYDAPRLINLPKLKREFERGTEMLLKPTRAGILDTYIELFIIYLSPTSSVYLRLLDAIEDIRKTRTGDETWTTHLLMLYTRMYGIRKQKERKAKIYFANCSPFLREGEDPNGPPKSRGNVGAMMVIEVLLGCTILSLLITLIGWQSHWFSRGESSRTERAIIMLWLCEGAFGLLLPLISLKELIMIFFLLPFYTTVSYTASSKPFEGLLLFERINVIAFVPIAIFIAPVWTFVLVGRMLVEWGRCVRLY
ncbi:hypothetical protein EKO04_010007 [Ascochyta lentis]|uniref:Uncharacterized protein n=1 Tax=Ascochyta lentis TaxID=205686 RepID=A0A8H7IZ13_9PLEO|nr:hypothetical protein EKO04_010007 [Ascochyta lentis]